MFTGIVEELGEVAYVDATVLAVRGPLVAADLRHGDSVAVNGVCLTVVETGDGVVTFNVMGETLRRSSLGALRSGSPVNLERAATLGSRLGGHLVQGHVDGVGTLLSREPAGDWEVVRVALPAELGRYVVEKGSITVDG
ncbi:MAG TPA: riboflavin synthase, partial [Actinoplanes sp.]